MVKISPNKSLPVTNPILYANVSNTIRCINASTGASYGTLTFPPGQIVAEIATNNNDSLIYYTDISFGTSNTFLAWDTITQTQVSWSFDTTPYLGGVTMNITSLEYDNFRNVLYVGYSLNSTTNIVLKYTMGPYIRYPAPVKPTFLVTSFLLRDSTGAVLKNNEVSDIQVDEGTGILYIALTDHGLGPSSTPGIYKFYPDGTYIASNTSNLPDGNKIIEFGKSNDNLLVAVSDFAYLPYRVDPDLLTYTSLPYSLATTQVSDFTIVPYGLF